MSVAEVCVWALTYTDYDGARAHTTCGAPVAFTVSFHDAEAADEAAHDGEPYGGESYGVCARCAAAIAGDLVAGKVPAHVTDLRFTDVTGEPVATGLLAGGR